MILFLFLKFQFPCLIRENKSHQFNEAIYCIMLVGTGVQGEPNEVESQATFSARLICKQAMFFFFFFFF